MRNLLTSETQTLNGQASKVVSYTHDADGLRLQMNSPSGSPVDYTWTAKGQLNDISRDGPPPLATYTYDKAGRLDLLAHENTISEDLTHDAAGQLLSRIHKKSGTTVSGHNYVDSAGFGIDSTGRRTLETFSDGTTPDRTYGYDNADQVTSATYDTGISDAYNYDAMGNRTTATLAINSGATTTYTANNVNQYTVISGFSAPVHDANGNLTFQNGVTYTWDSENRLLSITDGTTTNTYTYDGQHRRVTKRTTVSGTVTNKVHYLYDGWNVIEERTNTDTTTTFTLSTFSLTRTLTWGTDLSGSLQGAGGVGGLLMAEEITSTTTTAYHYHFDGNGNVTEITDASGNSAATYRYDAFGNTLIATGTYAVTNKYRFSNKPIDEEITTAPLYYYGYRYYDSATGRWPSRDPIGENGGVNLYGFIYNNGVNWLDPDGLMPQDSAPNESGNYTYDNYVPGPNLFSYIHDFVEECKRRDAECCLSIGRILEFATRQPVDEEGNPILTGTVGIVPRMPAVHKNSLGYVGKTHVYRVKGPDGSTYKIGESAQGVRVGDGASIRGEQQARRLIRETGDTYTTEIRKILPDKAKARNYETRVIDRFRRIFGQDTLPGNKTNR